MTKMPLDTLSVSLKSTEVHLDSQFLITLIYLHPVEAYVDRSTIQKLLKLSVVEDYAHVLYTHVSRSCCCFDVPALIPGTSWRLSSRVTV